jgi:hypothetical protein
MQSSPDTFLAERLFALENPALCRPVVALCRHLVVGSKNQPAQDAHPIEILEYLDFDVANLVFNELFAICGHGR